MKLKHTLLLTATAVSFASCSSEPKQNGEESNQSDSTQTEEVTEQEEVAKPSGYAIGDEATDFNLPATDGQMISLAGYGDAKGFIICFTCNHCPYAKAYEQRIIELDNMFAPKGYPVIAINPNDPEIVPEDDMESMKKLAEEKEYPFPYVLDENQEIYPQYGATKTPHMYVLENVEGKYIVRYIGAIDNNYKDAAAADEFYVQDAVNALLAGEEVSVTETKAIGCSIKDKRS